MKMYMYALLILAGTFIAAISQVMLKIEANKPHKSHLQEYLNPLVIFAYVLFVGTTLLSISGNTALHGTDFGGHQLYLYYDIRCEDIRGKDEQGESGGAFSDHLRNCRIFFVRLRIGVRWGRNERISYILIIRVREIWEEKN